MSRRTRILHFKNYTLSTYVIRGVGLELFDIRVSSTKPITVTIPADVHTILSRALKPNNDLVEKIKFECEDGHGVTEIDDKAFYECKALKKVVFPETLVSIGEGAFERTGLKSIKLKSNVALKNYAFSECEALEKVSFECPISTIPKETFYHCKNLSEINFPEGLEYIGTNAFNGCDSLTEISLPKSLNTIDTWAFYNCPNLSNICLYENTEYDVESFDDASIIAKTSEIEMEL